MYMEVLLTGVRGRHSAIVFSHRVHLCRGSLPHQNVAPKELDS